MSDKWVVEGYLMKGKKYFAQFKNQQEADADAEQMANDYKGQEFNVTGPNDVIGLDDHHYKYDDYFKRAVAFCHND